MKPKSRGSRLPIVLALAAALILAYVFRERFYVAAAQALIHDEPPMKADLIVVLAGDVRGERAVCGAKLVRDGWAPKAILNGSMTIFGFPESDLAYDFILKAGYPASYFEKFQLKADSTVSEGVILHKYLNERGVRKAIIVSHDYHTARSARILRKEMPGIELRIVACPDKEFGPTTWWHSRNGQRVFLLEWTKTINTYLGN